MIGEVERSLVAAICAAPELDAPRLVYADWLLERGDAHGELIVVQCELARERDDARRAVLEARALEVRQGLPALDAARKQKVFALGFERGFPIRVIASGGGEGHVGDRAITALTPRLDLWTGTADGIDALAAGGELPWLRRLRLSSRGGGIGPRGAAVLAGAAVLEHVTALELPDQHLGRAGLRELARMTELSALDISKDELTGLTARWPRLDRLALSYCQLDARDMRTLSEADGLADLGALALSINPIGDPATWAIRDAGWNIHTLDLAYTGISSDGLATLWRAPNVDLVELDLGSNEDVRAVLGEIGPRFPRLHTAKLSSLDATDRDAAALFRSLGAAVRVLDLSRNDVTAAAIEALAAAACRPTRLTLASNTIGAAGATVLATAPSFAGLEYLDASFCGLGVAGLEALARSETLPRGLELVAYGHPVEPALKASLEARFAKVSVS